MCTGLHKLRMCPADRGESRQRVLWGRCPYSKSGSGYIEAGHGRHGHMGRTTWAISRGRGMGAKSQRGGVVEMCWVRFSCPAQTTRYHCTDRLLTPPATGQKPLPEKQMCLYLRLGFLAIWLYGLCYILCYLDSLLQLYHCQKTQWICQRARRRRWSHWERDLNLAWGVFAAQDLSITAAVRY